MKLIPGEAIEFKNSIKGKSKNKSDIISDESVIEKYKKGQARIVTEQARYPLNTIVSLVESGNYLLTPDFQRRHRWDNVRKSKLIESFIINVPIPPVFLYETTYSKYEVMDGLQRISTIYEFYRSNFCLEGLVEWPELNGYDYKNLPDIIKLGIDRRYLSSIILLQETAKNEEDAQKMKQLVFERLNSGGVDLSDQEIRNALYDGELNQLCIRLSTNPTYKKLFSIPQNISNEGITDNHLYNKMEDVELILRFFAFRQIEKWDSTYIKSFLDSYLVHGNKYNSSTIAELAWIFEETIDLIFNMLGNTAFRLWRKSKSKNINDLVQAKQPTKVLYDPLMYVFSQYIKQKDIILKKKIEISNSLKSLFDTNADAFVSRFNKNDILKRCELIENMLKQIIGE